MRKSAALTVSALGIVTMLASAQLVGRFGEYFECVNRALHSERPIQGEVIRENCRCLHLYHPFCAW